MSVQIQALVRGLTWLYRPLTRRVARQALQGRLLDDEDPRRGRWLPNDVDAFIENTWKRIDELLMHVRLDELPTHGNRHNAFLAVVTTAAYQTLLHTGVSPKYAAVLVGDLGWKVYRWMLNLAAFPARITSRDPYKRMERTVRTWTEGDQFFTHWTHCPPHKFVRQLVKERGDRGELDAFYTSWCLYDWPAADLLAGDGKRGHHSRPQTMSRGVPVCDMCWRGRALEPRLADTARSQEEGS